MIKLLDCTLRDGAYIVNSDFGSSTIKGIISKLEDANVDIIECGWLKNDKHKDGSSFFHKPSDLKKYVTEKNNNCTYSVMIDWDRYDLLYLDDNDGSCIDAIRVVFPHDKCFPGVEVGKKIKDKGYDVFFQIANTLAYSDSELILLAEKINEINPASVSIVDTFGAMFYDDLERIMRVLDEHLNSDIALGFHSHNNQQLSFALSIHFCEWMTNHSKRDIIVDSSLCGMGRGAGNATTELMSNYLNKKFSAKYNLDYILESIDTYMQYFSENYTWGYSTPYLIAGIYCCHVNNIAYLTNNHRTKAKDMRKIISSLRPEDRVKYDYDLLESKYIENQSANYNDADDIQELKEKFNGKPVLIIAPGKTVIEHKKTIEAYIANNDNLIVIAANAIITGYTYDYLFLTNKSRYDYARSANRLCFDSTDKIFLSGVKTEKSDGEYVINYKNVVKSGWEHFDNAMILLLRALSILGVNDISIAGFDEFKDVSYADQLLPKVNSDSDFDKINEEIIDMFKDFIENNPDINFKFITETKFGDCVV